MSTSLAFTLSRGEQEKFGPRAGRLVLARPDSQLEIATPGLLTSTSRGVVPHVSWDQYSRLAGAEDENAGRDGALKWVNVVYESFLEQNPPTPLVYAEHLKTISEEKQGSHIPTSKPLNKYLGFRPDHHILSITPRDPDATQQMPPNGDEVVHVGTVRGIRKLTPAAYRSAILALQPDLIFAPHDTPFTTPPYSQKRLVKSIDRSADWIISLVGGVGGDGAKSIRKKRGAGAQPSNPQPTSASSSSLTATKPPLPAPLIAPLIGSTSHTARTYYAHRLIEPLDISESDRMNAAVVNTTSTSPTTPMNSVDDAVAGYAFELRGITHDIAAANAKTADGNAGVKGRSSEDDETTTTTLQSLLRASLDPLPHSKPRIALGVRGPGEMLDLIEEVGIDVFDASWAIDFATKGIGLDFVFPAPSSPNSSSSSSQSTTQSPNQRQIGHNIYSTAYTFDFSPIADAFRGASSSSSSSSPSSSSSSSSSSPTETENTNTAPKPVCPCPACSPLTHTGDAELLRHGVDDDAWIGGGNGGREGVISRCVVGNPAFVDSEGRFVGAGAVTEAGAVTVLKAGAGAGSVASDKGRLAAAAGPRPRAQRYNPAHTRAYIHHLLHTHEMGAHALLVGHNLAVVESFLAAVRAFLYASPSSSSSTLSSSSSTLSSSSSSATSAAAAASASVSERTTETAAATPSPLAHEIARFKAYYNADPASLLAEATADWRAVDLARGKGRLAREAAKGGPDSEVEGQSGGTGTAGGQKEEERLFTQKVLDEVKHVAGEGAVDLDLN